MRGLRRSAVKLSIMLVATATFLGASIYWWQRGADGAGDDSASDMSTQNDNTQHEQAAPLTDVAPPQPEVQAQRRQDLKPVDPSAWPKHPQPRVIPPKIRMDLKNPPQWTQTLAQPKTQLTPPDPFKAPPIKVDPRRVRPEE